MLKISARVASAVGHRSNTARSWQVTDGTACVEKLHRRSLRSFRTHRHTSASAQAVTAITPLPLRPWVLSASSSLGVIGDSPMHRALAVRVEAAVEHNCQLRKHLSTLRAQAKAEVAVAHQLRAQIRAWNAVVHLRLLRPTIWRAIELSERYGTLRERTAILMLAEAFMSGNDTIEKIAQAA
jgi:hypothetical protein